MAKRGRPNIRKAKEESNEIIRTLQLACKSKGGRKKTYLDWNQIFKQLEAGVTAHSIADDNGIDRQTLYNRCLDDLGVHFSALRQIKHLRGDDRIRETQYSKALEGDNTMLIWLGKNRLGQMDRKEIVVQESIDQIAAQLANALNAGASMVSDSTQLDRVIDAFCAAKRVDKTDLMSALERSRAELPPIVSSRLGLVSGDVIYNQVIEAEIVEDDAAEGDLDAETV